MKTKINAKIVADSIDWRGNRIISYVVTFPRYILAELNTHRMFSRNSASSRAIPFEKMLEYVRDEPFTPMAFQKNHSGMQGKEYFTDENDIDRIKSDWMIAASSAADKAYILNSQGVTKQICNRILEPYMWHTVLVTATEYDNFFELRCPEYHFNARKYKSKKDCIDAHKGLETTTKMMLEQSVIDWLKMNKGMSEIHMMELAECMWDARNESQPKKLKEGDWHIPFGDKITKNQIEEYFGNFIDEIPDDVILELKLKISVARCARLSYMTFDGEIDFKKDIALFVSLKRNKHWSPFEHVARVMSDDEYVLYYKGKADFQRRDRFDWIELTDQEDSENFGWCRNYRGFIQYRVLVD